VIARVAGTLDRALLLASLGSPTCTRRLVSSAWAGPIIQANLISKKKKARRPLALAWPRRLSGLGRVADRSRAGTAIIVESIAAAGDPIGAVSKKGCACTRRIYKKQRQTTLSVLRRRRAAVRFRRRISLPRHVFRRFLYRDSVLPLCPHSILFYTILIALATACLQHRVRSLPIRD
jgi:hypothetical protein